MLVLFTLLSSSIVYGQSDDKTVLTGEVDLARIVDLACRKRGIDVRYDPTVVKGTVTVRTNGTGLSDEELWDLMQRALANKGLTTVFEPGDAQLRLVRLADAENAARLDLDGQVPEDAGYVTILIEISNTPVDDVVASVKSLLSTASGDIRRLGKTSSYVLLSELESRIAQTLEVIELIDAPRPDLIVRKISPQFLRPTILAQQISLATKVREGLVGRPMQGAIVPTLDDSAILLIAPESEVRAWEDLVAQFDVPQPVTTETYQPESYTPDEVASLLQDTCRSSGPRGSGDQWQLVRDSLTGSLIVTATHEEHVKIRSLLDRLTAHQVANGGVRTVIRQIRIRNRDLTELHATLDALLQAGVVADVQRAGHSSDSGAGIERRADGIDRSDAAARQSPIAAGDAVSPGPRGSADNGSAGRSRRGSSNGAGTSIRVSETDELTITTDSTTASLILMGPPRLLDDIEALVVSLDVREPQVMLEVIVISLNESDLQDFGIELQKLEISGSTLMRLASTFGLSDLSVSDINLASAEGGQGLSGMVLNPGDFSVVVRALQSINDGRTLVRPKVLVNNGESAFLDAVRREPVQSTNASNTVATTSFSGTVDAGTQLTLRPQIADGDHLVLDYDITLSAFVGDSADPSLPPPRIENSLSSVVTIPDGHTIVLGGLETTQSSEGVSQVPLLGELPLIGEVFKNRSSNETLSRFFVFVCPTILRHDGFDDLRFLSEHDRITSGVEDGWPTVEPRIIR